MMLLLLLTLPPLPDEHGVAGAFAGVSHGSLIVAGGSNWPGKKPWEGGVKHWSDAVYVLEKPDGEWRKAGTLLAAVAGGVSVTHKDRIICIGGGSAERNSDSVNALTWKDGRVRIASLPSLPTAMADGCGALVGDKVYVFGGTVKPNGDATADGYALDLAAAKPVWTKLPAFPGPARILPLAAGLDDEFYVIGGATLKNGKRTYLKDGYRLRSGKWEAIAALPSANAAAPSPAPTDEGGFYLVGGDDGKQFEKPQATHTGFSKAVQRYDAKRNEWKAAGECEQPRAVAQAVRWQDCWWIISGETRPGVRDPKLVEFTLPRR